MALLRLIEIHQHFKEGYALTGINLSIDRGEVFGLIGPTGAGKTTLLRIIDMLDSPRSGRILFDGKDVTESRHERLRARRRMSYVQQRPTVFSMNVFDNVAIGLKWRRIGRSETRQRVNRALELVRMHDYVKRDARTLSGGETQRVAIARALVTEPELLLLDEPTASLDPGTAERIEDILADIISTKRITIIMSTHDMSQGQRLADRIGVLMDGEMLQVGTPAEVFRSPKRKRVADFVGVGNMLPGVIAGRLDEDLAEIAINGNVIQALSNHDVGTTVWVLIRTEDVIFSLARTSTSARNVFEGPISRMTAVGNLVRLEIDCGFPLTGVVTTKSLEEMGLKLGSYLYASFKATAVHVIPRKA